DTRDVLGSGTRSIESARRRSKRRVRRSAGVLPEVLVRVASATETTVAVGGPSFHRPNGSTCVESPQRTFGCGIPLLEAFLQVGRVDLVLAVAVAAFREVRSLLSALE